MFVEEKKVVGFGNSNCVTIKRTAGLALQKGEKIKVTYTENKIIIERVK